MARSIDEIYNLILAEKASKPELDVLNSTSRVSIYNLWAFITAVVIWSHEKIFDAHKLEVDEIIATKKPHRLRWYRDKSLLFQYGQDLVDDTDQYDNTGMTDAQIEAAQIIKYAAVTEIDGKLRIKTAKEVAGELHELTADELSAFTGYIFRVKDAGVRIISDSLPADSLKLEIDIWYNPLVLRADGTRIDGVSATPIKDAIKAFLRTLPFNGEYANTRLIDYLQGVDGVVFPVIKMAMAKFGLFPFSSIDEKYIPDAGYMRVADADLTINYREYHV